MKNWKIDYGERNDGGLSDYLKSRGYASLGKLLENKNEYVRCDKCNEIILGEPPAMFFKGGNVDDQRFLCIDCAPNPFD